MQKRTNTIFISIFLFVILLSLFFLSQIPFLQGGSIFFSIFTTPLQKVTFAFFQPSQTGEIARLTKENQVLAKRLVDQKKLITENNALKDQFSTNKPDNKTLLPVSVIGAPGFIPGTQPEELLIDKGSAEGIAIGEAVVINNNLVGSIDRVSSSLAVIRPLERFTQSFTGKTVTTNAAGLVISDSDGVRLDNVLLSDVLQKGDLVVTKGDVDEKGKGFLPDIVIGKIVSIDKKPSSLFQSAKVQSFIDLSRLTTVFVVLSQK